MNVCKLVALVSIAVLSIPAHAELKVFYSFDDGANLLADGSGNNTVATNYGAVFSAAGYQGGALSVDGVNDFVRVSLDVNASVVPQMTWGAWVNLSSNSPIRQILSNDNGGYDRTIGIDYRGGTSGQFSAFTGYGVLGNGPVAPLDRWTFVAAVYDNASNSVSYWVDGTKVTAATAYGSSWGFFDIAHNPSYGQFLSGKVDNVFVYNEALTDAQINTIRLGGASAIAPVPEPESYAMLLAGLGLVGWVVRRRN